MKTIEFDNQQISVPTSWNEITLGDYEQWSQCEDSTQCLGSICKVNTAVLEEAPQEVLEKIAHCLSFITNEDIKPSESVKIEDVSYYITDSNDLLLGTVVDIETINEEKRITLLSDSLALLCKPLGEGYDESAIAERAHFFRKQTCDKMLPLVHHFLYRDQVAQETVSQSVEMLSMATQFLQESKDFIKNENNMKQLSSKQRKKYTTLVKSLEEQLANF